MKKVFRRSIVFLLTVMLMLGLTACGNVGNPGNNAESIPSNGENVISNAGKTKIQIACMSIYEPVILWVKDVFEQKGYNYEIETVLFDSNIQPAIALKDGDVDGLVHNHLPWLITFNSENNCDLQMPKPHMFYGRFAIYSSRYDSISDLPQNAQIAVPNDSTNMERSLLILQEVGLIKLGEKQEAFYNWLDVVENPKNISLVETEITQTGRAMNDVDALVCYGNRVEMAGYDPNNYIFEDPAVVDYPIGLVVQAKDVDQEWVKLFQETCASEKVIMQFREYYKGTYVLYSDRTDGI